MNQISDTPETAAEREKYLGQGRNFLKAGQHQAAHAIADRLLRDYAPTPATLLFAGEVQFSMANFVGTQDIANRCSALFPDDLGGPLLQCRALMAMGKQGDARDVALGIDAKDVTEEAHLSILVTILSGCMEPEAAYPLCKRSIELDAYNPAAHRRLALNCRLTGRLDEAEEAANIALRFDSHDYEMIGFRSSLRKATAEDNHIGELEALLAGGCKNALGAAGVAYAAAKECEDIGQYERSFGFLESGAKLKRSTMRGGADDDLQSFELLREIYTTAALSEPVAGSATSEPIFVLGLPRTGSTLLERILSSHSGVYAAGELLHFDAALMHEILKLGPLTDRRDLVSKSLKVDAAAVGDGYLQRTRPFTGHTPRFIDKRPLNFASIGAISRSLPNAGIVHVRRTPMDACYSIFKFLFGDAYPWSYDLGDIARYYAGYRQLMDHWREVLPGRVIDVSYEALVSDIENETRTLLRELNLDWEPACLDFHENTAATLTGSAVQVRQTLYASSVGRWRDYEKQLEPLAEKLKEAGIDPYTP